MSGCPASGTLETMTIRVLVVDDDAGFRRVASALLAARGMEVVGESPDAESAPAAVLALRPDWVLMDLHLPGADGLSASRAIGLLDQPPRILLTSTESSFASAEELEGCGVCAFVPKDELFAADLVALFSSAGTGAPRAPGGAAPRMPAAG